MASWTAGICTAVFHIGCSSRGGPGSTTTVGLPGTTTPGAVPTGSITTAPTGTMACLRLAARTASKSPVPMRAISFFKISAILFSSSASSTSSRPQNRATVATVMSSAVGPSPPLVTIRSTPSSAMKRSCGFDVGGAVTADGDVGELDAQLEKPVGEPRAVAVGNPTGQDLGSGDDNARACAHRYDIRPRRTGGSTGGAPPTRSCWSSRRSLLIASPP